MQASGSSGALSRQSILFSSRTCAIKIYNGTNHTVCYWSIPADVHFSVYIPVTISWPYWDEFCYQVGRVKEDPSLASVLDKDTGKNLRSYPWQYASLLKKEQKEYLKGEVGQAERHWHLQDKLWVSRTKLLYIHLGGCALMVLIDSCKLYNNRLYCTCLSHNPVCYNQMYVCAEYLWTLNELPPA